MQGRSTWQALIRRAVALSLGLACGRMAHARDTVPANLRWAAPAECPSAAAVLERLSDLLGETPADWARYERVQVTIQRAATAGWALTLQLERQGEVQSRTLGAARCDELANAAAVALAIALGDDANMSTASSEPPAAPLPAALSPGDPVSPRDTGGAPSVARPSPAARVAVVLGAEGVLDTPTLGGAGLGLALHAELRRARLGLGLYGVLLPARSEPVAVARSESVDFSLLAGGVRGCYRLLDARAHADGCVVFEAGRLSADAQGLRDAESTRDLWLATGAGLALGWEVVPAFALQARTEALLPLLQEQYVINSTERINTTPRASLRLALGIIVPIR
jgi:hypothetical protein